MSLSCFEFGEELLSVEDAQAALRELTPAALGTETIGLSAALDRVLAEAALSPIDVPQNTNSAMDGIAVAWTGSETLRLVGEVLAGSRFTGTIEAGEAVTITTGAPLPSGADSVIMREQLIIDAAAGRVRVLEPETVRRGQNVRQAGEDIARGSLAVAAGTRLRPQHLGFLASLGRERVMVHRRPRVALFSTGDEVTAPGATLPDAGIFDANRFSLRGLIERLGGEVIDLGILADDCEAIHAALEAAVRDADMVITSGGVSVGQADWVKGALQRLGRLGFWRIAMRPGRPLAFGVLGPREVPFFGLPGNPVSAMVTFLQFVQPLLRRLQGETAWCARRLVAVADEPLSSRAGRVDFHRGLYTGGPDGRLHVRTTGPQGSGMLSSMVAANCLIEIDAERDHVSAGDTVTIQPFGELT